MLPLSERHADRAKRKAENALEGSSVKGQDHLTDIVASVAAAQESLNGLSDDDRREVYNRLDNAGEPSEDYVPTDPGARPYAGIGLVNPFEVPVTQSGNGGGLGEAGLTNLTPEEIRNAGDEAVQRAASEGWGADPSTGNLNGAAIDAAGGQTGQGDSGNANEAKDETLGEDGKPLTKEKLKAILDARTPPVSYETDANLERLQELVRGPAPAAS